MTYHTYFNDTNNLWHKTAHVKAKNINKNIINDLKYLNYH